jgi:stress-induced morphogen
MTCPRCVLNATGHAQVYMVKGELGLYVFDVEHARRIVADGGHFEFEVEPSLIELMLAVNEEHTPEHIDHVDPTRPGIIAQRFGGYTLIDGNHRARRCLRDQLRFRVHALTLHESMECLILQQQNKFTAPLVARELRGMLKNNPECEMLEVTLTSDEAQDASESAIRDHLTPEENARVTITIEQECSHS